MAPMAPIEEKALDSYEAILDKITTDLEEVKLQKCKCGYLGANFHGHIRRHQREFIIPEDGSIQGNAMMELQDNRTNGQISNCQETSYKTSTRAGWQVQDVRLKQKSNLQE